MPSTSAKQAKFMRAVANSPKFAKKVGVPQSVGKDYEMADKKMKKFGSGGASSKPKPSSGSPEADDVLITTPKGKKILEEQRRRDAEAERKRREKQNAADKLLGIGAKKGGTMADKAGRAMTRKTADTMGRAMKMNKGGKCYAKGGSVSARADGIAKKGKTKGKMLARGGMMSKMTPRTEYGGVERKKGGKC